MAESAEPVPDPLQCLFALCADCQFLWPDGKRHRSGERPTGPGYLCLFAGNRRVAKAVCREKDCCALTFDWKHGPEQDLANQSLQDAIITALSSGYIVGIGLSPSCPSLSSSQATPKAPWLPASYRPPFVSGLLVGSRALFGVGFGGSRLLAPSLTLGSWDPGSSIAVYSSCDEHATGRPHRFLQKRA